MLMDVAQRHEVDPVECCSGQSQNVQCKRCDIWILKMVAIPQLECLMRV